MSLVSVVCGHFIMLYIIGQTYCGSGHSGRKVQIVYCSHSGLLAPLYF